MGSMQGKENSSKVNYNYNNSVIHAITILRRDVVTNVYSYGQNVTVDLISYGAVKPVEMILFTAAFHQMRTAPRSQENLSLTMMVTAVMVR